ncbi:hypothetical protein H0H87_010447, partial [Tephrocybe sp. NHM501043]
MVLIDLDKFPTSFKLLTLCQLIQKDWESPIDKFHPFRFCQNLLKNPCQDKPGRVDWVKGKADWVKGGRVDWVKGKGIFPTFREHDVEFAWKFGDIMQVIGVVVQKDKPLISCTERKRFNVVMRGNGKGYGLLVEFNVVMRGNGKGHRLLDDWFKIGRGDMEK